MKTVFSLDLFCQVVDNFGDAGVCWRLARQLVHEHHLRVVLWIDQLETLQKICPAIKNTVDEQRVSGVIVRYWPRKFPDVLSTDIPDAVVEGFGCRLPDSYIKAIADKASAPAWINMEYLSAEPWVNDCHKMRSPQASVPLTKYFFFPGFVPETGGLFREANLLSRRQHFQQDEANRESFLKQLGVCKNQDDCVISLFCYETAPVKEFFDELAHSSERHMLCLVPDGVAKKAVSEFLEQDPGVGVKKTRANLTVQVIPIVDQDDYDKLLWSCDLNFVRGEDSFMRAQWAARPFIWQIYPQEQAAHLIKLDAFLDRYLGTFPLDTALQLRQRYHAWNKVESLTADDKTVSWLALVEALPELTQYEMNWADNLAEMADFASSLVRFISSMR